MNLILYLYEPIIKNNNTKNSYNKKSVININNCLNISGGEIKPIITSNINRINLRYCTKKEESIKPNTYNININKGN